jgi:uncharacterized protein
MRFGIPLALIALPINLQAVTPVQAPAAQTVTFEVTGAASDKGLVRVSLCGDPKGTFPGACVNYSGFETARRGATITVTIPGVAPGRYAVQAYHDENSNGRAEVPPEGYAFGNGAQFPPTFDAAAITVGQGATRASLKLQYAGQTPTAEAQGSHGAEAPAGIERVDLREQGLYGELYLPAGATKPLPALVLIGGSEGGLNTMSQMAVSFAQKGYATLALAYWAEQGLPQQLQGIPLEYFDRGIDWLAKHPRVDAKSIGLLGWSRGGEAALLIGSRNPKLRAVVAVAPSGIVWQGMGQGAGQRAAWTVKGSPLPFVIPDSTGYRPDAKWAAVFEARLAEADSRPDTAIPVERMHASLLLITGSDDGIWPSRRFADRITARLQAEGFKQKFQHLTYDGAGHFIFVGAPDSMLARQGAASSGGMMGGTAAANAAAWKDNWPRTLAFLEDALQEKK